MVVSAAREGGMGFGLDGADVGRVAVRISKVRARSHGSSTLQGGAQGKLGGASSVLPTRAGQGLS